MATDRPLSDVLPHKHQWVLHTLQPVVVTPDDDGEPVIFVDPDKLETTVYGCHACSAPLNKETISTACAGFDDGED